MPQNEQPSAHPRRAVWEPIRTGALPVKILEAIWEIAAALPQATSAEEFDLSLSDGAAGSAVLYAYLSGAIWTLQLVGKKPRTSSGVRVKSRGKRFFKTG